MTVPNLKPRRQVVNQVEKSHLRYKKRKDHENNPNEINVKQAKIKSDSNEITEKVLQNRSPCPASMLELEQTLKKANRDRKNILYESQLQANVTKPRVTINTNSLSASSSSPSGGVNFYTEPSDKKLKEEKSVFQRLYENNYKRPRIKDHKSYAKSGKADNRRAFTSSKESSHIHTSCGFDSYYTTAFGGRKLSQNQPQGCKNNLLDDVDNYKYSKPNNADRLFGGSSVVDSTAYAGSHSRNTSRPSTDTRSRPASAPSTMSTIIRRGSKFSNPVEKPSLLTRRPTSANEPLMKNSSLPSNTPLQNENTSSIRRKSILKEKNTPETLTTLVTVSVRPEVKELLKPRLVAFGEGKGATQQTRYVVKTCTCYFLWPLKGKCYGNDVT